MPGAPHIVLVDAAVLDVFALRLLLKSGLPGEPKGSAYALGPVHAALAVLLIVGLVDGVILVPRGTSLAGDLHAWLYLFHLVVLFVVTLAVLRTIGVWRVVRIVVAMLLVTVAVAVGEWITGRGWSLFFFEHLPANYLGAGAVELTKRGGHVRPQVAAQFSLEYGWVLAMYVPLAIYAAVRTARHSGIWARVAFIAPLALILGIVLTRSRSSEVVIPILIVLFVAGSGADRSLRKWVLGLLGIAVLIFAINPALLTKAFSVGAATDPLSIRFNRLPVLFAMVVHHRLTGIGFSGTTSAFGGLDNAYALMYATIGVIGLVAWIGLFVTAGATVARGLRSPRQSSSRLVGAACLAGIVGIFAGAVTYDFQDTVQSPWGLIILAAIGTAAAERVPRTTTPMPRRWLLRSLVPATGVALGFALFSAVPTSASEALSVQTVAPWVIAYDVQPVSPYQGSVLVHTLCSLITNPDTIAPGTGVNCLQAVQFKALADPGLALVTVRGPTPAAVRSETVRAFTPAFSAIPMAGGPSGTIQVGKPAWAATAPVWGGLAGLMIMLLFPPISVRRSSRSRQRSIRSHL
ncbi:MAG: O-antigen ligase family protein [Acidimicrobiales bacterium]